MVKVTVLGGGSWGTAISLMLLNNGHQVKIWDRSKEVLSLIDEGENLRYLPGVRIPHSIITEPDINRSLEHADIVVIAIPVQYIRAVLNSIDKSKLKRKTIFVNLSKGMEISSLKLPQYIFKEIIGDFNYCTLSGPSHAEEVSRGVPTSVVVASKKRRMNEYIQKIFSSKTFRVYSNEDLIGVEISGAVKNIYAIGAGVIDGFGKWDNTKAALITRAIVEINRYGRHYGGKKETFMGLAGVGDLVVTCTSSHSRNRYVGEKLSTGKNLGEIIKEMSMVAEGVYTAKAVYNDARAKNIEMPIAFKIYEALYEELEPKNAIYDLMTRDLKSEFFY